MMHSPLPIESCIYNWITKYLPAVAGNHLIKEINNINLYLKKSKPNLALIGGSKISTK